MRAFSFWTFFWTFVTVIRIVVSYVFSVSSILNDIPRKNTSWTLSSLIPQPWMMNVRKGTCLNLFLYHFLNNVSRKEICLNLCLDGLDSLENRMHHWINWKTTLPLVKIKVFFIENRMNSDFWLEGINYRLTPYISTIWEVKQYLTSSAWSDIESIRQPNSVILYSLFSL